MTTDATEAANNKRRAVRVSVCFSDRPDLRRRLADAASAVGKSIWCKRSRLSSASLRDSCRSSAPALKPSAERIARIDASNPAYCANRNGAFVDRSHDLDDRLVRIHAAAGTTASALT